MIILDRSNIQLEIDEVVFDHDLYWEVVEVFQRKSFYKSADLVIPSFSDGVTIVATGEAGVDYRIEVGDLAFNFTESSDLFLPAESIISRVMEIKVFKEGSYVGGIDSAFITYILFTYVLVQVIIDNEENLNESKISRYLLDNLIFSEGFETYFSNLYGIGRIDDWEFETYRDVIIQLISAMKDPERESSLRELISSIGLKTFIKNINETFNLASGYARLDNSHWARELQ